jgi:uncharacterized protein (DUF433 family)
MTTALDGHIEVDDHGVARIAGSRMKVIHLVMDKIANDSSPEEMARQFGPISLAQIHAAFAYYYDHKTELDAQIQRSVYQAEELENQSSGTPSRAELKERLARLTGERKQP